MKIKNIDMVNFLNASNGLFAKKLPVRLNYAMLLNQKMFIDQFLEAYEYKHAEIVKSGDKKALTELITTEMDANIQTVPIATVEMIDSDPRFDALSPKEYAALVFMIEE